MAAQSRVVSSHCVVTETAASVEGYRASVFMDICGAGSNLCIWRRNAQADIVRELEALAAVPLLAARCRVTARTFSHDLDGLMTGAGLVPALFPAWRTDLATLARLFFPHADGREVELRLETSDDDGCRRYHVDRSHLRMLCTYRGPGTQWLTNEQVDRTALRSCGSNESIVRSGAPRRLATFWVGLFKGSLHPHAIDGGLVHRSPPIAGTGERRVLFCLDC